MLWALSDHLGTVRDLIDSTGNVVNHLRYEAFGRITSETNAAVDFLFAYTGRERDEESGLFYYRARYYDPAVGRFISEDPLGFAAGDANLARYVSNESLIAIDPTGQSKISVIIKIRGVVQKVLKLDYETLIRYGKNKTRTQTGSNVFIHIRDAKSAAQKMSPVGKAVKHPRNDLGHPPPYHPVVDYTPDGEPITTGTPHVSDQYIGRPPGVIPTIPSTDLTDDEIEELM
ncbi:MAG: hypothetical protein KatS3mg110_0030 [Pirellulaceae bacterium]|nr:MAG: hypothetical protein KatS3mg110_0030 [Pirellulaceae bacterium]